MDILRRTLIVYKNKRHFWVIAVKYLGPPPSPHRQPTFEFVFYLFIRINVFTQIKHIIDTQQKRRNAQMVNSSPKQILNLFLTY